MSRVALKPFLDRLSVQYDRQYLSTDPISLVHRYSDPADQEVAGLVASCLAYGKVGGILASASDALGRLGPRPAMELDRLEARQLRRRLRGFRHRFTSGKDLADLLERVAAMRRSHGSVGAFFREGHRADDLTLRASMVSFVRRALDLRSEGTRRARRPGVGVRFLLPSPDEGSACKRMNLFLRWMVRPADGVDLGLWSWIPARQLLMPVDTHVARIASYLGLTRRRSTGWKMVEEITESLRRLDPADPIRYDFALCRLGILDACPRRRDPVKCRACPLEPACQL